MYECGFLSERDYLRWKNYEMSYALPDDAYRYPYFLDYAVHWELVRLLGGLPQFNTTGEVYQAIYTGGLHIYTTLDSSLQVHAEEVLNTASLYPQTVYLDMVKVKEAISARRFIPGKIDPYINGETGTPQPQAAVVVADPVTGAVLSLVGDRGYHKQSNELLRYLSRRQPGSAIKPLVVYAPALEEGTLSLKINQGEPEKPSPHKETGCTLHSRLQKHFSLK